MWRKSRSSPSERYLAPPDDGIVEEEEEAVPDLLAKARRRGASVALSMDVGLVPFSLSIASIFAQA